MAENEPLSKKTPVGRELLSKVPQVTLIFWIIKIMATTVGQTAADFLKNNLAFGFSVTTVIMSVLFIVTIYLQMKAKKYTPLNYWLVVVFISVVGTLGTDMLTEKIGDTIGTITFLLALAASLFAWYKSEKTLSIAAINTLRREIFYWLSILFTFALGSAVGDWISENLSLNYFSSAAMFTAALGIVVIGHSSYKLNSILAFWLAFVLTRPFGASLMDFLSGSHYYGGLGIGTVGTSLAFLVIMVGIYVIKSKKDQNPIL